MDLLVDPWIPVRAFEERHPQTITLQRLCCSEEKWLLNLPPAAGHLRATR